MGVKVFLTYVIVAGVWTVPRSDRCNPSEITHDTHWIGAFVKSQNRAGRYGIERNLYPLPGIERVFLGCQFFRLSLYWLS
jgi:hypothetical protein